MLCTVNRISEFITDPSDSFQELVILMKLHSSIFWGYFFISKKSLRSKEFKRRNYALSDVCDFKPFLACHKGIFLFPVPIPKQLLSLITFKDGAEFFPVDIYLVDLLEECDSEFDLELQMTYSVYAEVTYNLVNESGFLSIPRFCTVSSLSTFHNHLLMSYLTTGLDNVLNFRVKF